MNNPTVKLCEGVEVITGTLRAYLIRRMGTRECLGVYEAIDELTAIALACGDPVGIVQIAMLTDSDMLLEAVEMTQDDVICYAHSYMVSRYYQKGVNRK